MSVVDRSFDHPLEMEERAAMPLAGGIMQHGFQCGMIWGSTLAAGAQAYRLLGPGSQAETGAIIAAQRVVESFRAQNNAVNCIDMTGMNRSSSPMQLTMHFLIKGGSIRCFRMAARYAPVAFSEINTALSGNHIEALSAPASCPAMLAHKMGASDMHTIMAAGLAGGIGLSGGGCGALGAAIWIMGMNRLREGAGKIDYKDPGALAVVNKFEKLTGSQFECSKIVGRRFGNVGDHAAYVRDGGCSEIIEALAAQ